MTTMVFRPTRTNIARDWWSKIMNQLTLLELLLAGFFGLACFRARATSTVGQRPKFVEFFQLSGRLERLRRSRWQWFSMVLLMFVLRMQNQLPASIEIIVAAEFLIFLALPAHKLGARVLVNHST
ncbi:MAG: hypothetical protein ACRD3P_12585 [Terriglobales bacterium]